MRAAHETCMRPTYFVPETKTIGALFWEMQASNQHVAIVVDEYSSTPGIVTIELLMEQMVGPVADELARTAKEFQTIDENTVQVDGGMSVSEANEELGIRNTPKVATRRLPATSSAASATSPRRVSRSRATASRWWWRKSAATRSRAS